MDAGTRAWSMGGLLSPVVGGEGRTAKISAAVTVAWNVAQAVASIVVLTLEWGRHCDQRLGLWLLIAAGRIILRIGLCIVAYKYYLVEEQRRTEAAAAGAAQGEEGGAADVPIPVSHNHPYHHHEVATPNGTGASAERSTTIDKMKEVLDVFHLVWFTLGNAWVFGSRTCRFTAPLTFYLSLSIIVVTYAVMLFPIVLAVLLIPFACFCLPCVLRVLVRLREAENQRGAPSAVIATLPSVKYQEGMFDNEDDTCPICLTDYSDGDMLRILKCSGSHHFHLECVDHWLRLNSVCPCCREPPTGATYPPVNAPGTRRFANFPAGGGGQQADMNGQDADLALAAALAAEEEGAVVPGAASTTTTTTASGRGREDGDDDGEAPPPPETPYTLDGSGRSTVDLLQAGAVNSSSSMPEGRGSSSLTSAAATPAPSPERRRRRQQVNRGVGWYMLFSLLRGNSRAAQPPLPPSSPSPPRRNGSNSNHASREQQEEEGDSSPDDEARRRRRRRNEDGLSSSASSSSSVALRAPANV